MLLMVVLGVVLRFVQEARADSAAAKLRAMISVHGDRPPRRPAHRSADRPLGSRRRGGTCRRRHDPRRCAADFAAKTCSSSRRSLTGESFPVEKFAAREETAGRSPLELNNVCYLGTSVESGTATAVVVATGLTTYLGGMSHCLRRANRRRPASTRA